jgi:hypothetical protein
MYSEITFLTLIHQNWNLGLRTVHLHPSGRPQKRITGPGFMVEYTTTIPALSVQNMGKKWVN